MFEEEITFEMDSSDSDAEIFNRITTIRRRKRRHYRQRINFDLDDFPVHFRLTRSAVENLHTNLAPYLEPKTARSCAFDTRQQLLMALQFFGSGGFYRLVGLAHGISTQATCTVIHRVTKAINDHVLPKVVCWPENPNDRADIARRFYDIAGFPSVFGCVDGTLIPIIRPSTFENAFVDRKGEHSINAVMVCGPEMQFYFVNANAPGSVHDARVFALSSLSRRLELGWRAFPRNVLLGDSGYPIREYLQTPLVQPNLSHQETVYNRRHKATRRLIECAFGILKERFACLKKLRHKDPAFASEVIMATVALHNIALRDQPQPEIEYDIGGNEEQDDERFENDSDDARNAVTARERGIQRRNEIIHML